VVVGVAVAVEGEVVEAEVAATEEALALGAGRRWRRRCLSSMRRLAAAGRI